MQICFLTIKSSIIFSDLLCRNQFLGDILPFYLLCEGLQDSTLAFSKEKTLELGKEVIIVCLWMEFDKVS